MAIWPRIRQPGADSRPSFCELGSDGARLAAMVCGCVPLGCAMPPFAFWSMLADTLAGGKQGRPNMPIPPLTALE
eukprot:358302-Chlamydomonas_euryale.AAC.9